MTVMNFHVLEVIILPRESESEECLLCLRGLPSWPSSGIVFWAARKVSLLPIIVTEGRSPAQMQGGGRKGKGMKKEFRCVMDMYGLPTGNINTVYDKDVLQKKVI